MAALFSSADLLSLAAVRGRAAAVLSGRIRFASYQAELLFGYDGDDLGARSIETLIPEFVCKTYQEYWQGTCPGPRSRGLNLGRSGRRQEGHWFPASINMSYVETRHGLIAEVRDLSDGHGAVR